MAGRFVRVRDRNQITVPPEVAERLQVRPGGILEFSISPAGTVELRPAKIVTVGTPEALREEEAAKEDIRQGRYTVIRNVDDYVDRVSKGDYPSARQPASPSLSAAEMVRKESVLADPAGDGMNGYVVHMADAAGNFTAVQKLEVQRMVEETVKKYVSGRSEAQTIIPQRAENAAE